MVKPVVRNDSTPSDPSAQALVRRLDWRFLLPEPRLPSVAFAGPRNGSLFAALHHAGKSVVRPPPSGIEKRDGGRLRKVAVVQGAERELVERVHPYLAPGGWLYWEIDCSSTRRAWPRAVLRRPRRPATSIGARATVRALGYDRITLQWHYPDFESCRWLVPLDDPSTCAYFLARDRGRLAGALLRRIGSGMGRIPLLPRFACISLVARKPRLSPAGIS